MNAAPSKENYSCDVVCLEEGAGFNVKDKTKETDPGRREREGGAESWHLGRAAGNIRIGPANQVCRWRQRVRGSVAQSLRRRYGPVLSGPRFASVGHYEVPDNLGWCPLSNTDLRPFPGTYYCGRILTHLLHLGSPTMAQVARPNSHWLQCVKAVAANPSL